LPRELLDFEKRNSRLHESGTECVSKIVQTKSRSELRFLHGLLEPQPAVDRDFIALRCDAFTPRSLFHPRQATVRGGVVRTLRGPVFPFTFKMPSRICQSCHREFHCSERRMPVKIQSSTSSTFSGHDCRMT